METRDQLEEQILLIKEMESLMESDGWKRLYNLLQARRLMFRNLVLDSDSEGLNGLIEDGKNKAALGELEAFLHLPRTLIDGAELEKSAIVQAMKDEEDKEDE